VTGDQHEQGGRPTIWQVIKSVLAAAIGVQTEQARVRDFTHGSPAVFIVAGIVFTVLFVLVLVLVLVVHLVLRSAGA
jgi:hypothetical protein